MTIPIASATLAVVEDNKKLCFFAAGDEWFHPSHPETHLTLNRQDALDLLGWLGYETSEDWGSLEASDLAARCRRRMWPIAYNIDQAKMASLAVNGRMEAQVIRPAGFLRRCVEDLLRVAARAGSEGFVLVM